ncbi:MAG: UpxY family transcription antiterminator [Bacteroidales bacterium]|nr:UpxY family transcription antiterminator [Bacteroidales bacterium]
MDTYKWYALYTRPRFEKKAEKIMHERGIRCYLPMIRTLRQWSDRKKWVDLPLFSSYIFVFSQASDLHKALSVPGAIRFVSFEGRPVEIPENQIENIKWILSADVVSQPLAEKIPQGAKVEIIKGPLRGLRAEMVHYNNRKKIVLRVDQLNQSVEIQIPENHVELVD